MQNTLRDCHTLIRVQLDCPVFKVNEQLAFKNKEKFIILIVLVPMIFALNNPNSNDTVVHFCQSLIEPFVLSLSHDCRYVNQFEMSKLDIQVGHVGVVLSHAILLFLRSFYPSA